MSVDDPTAGSTTAAEPVRRRDLAVARSLDSARLRSEGRVQRFLDAGFELLALFDEAILSTADRLEEQIARQDTPLERLHTFVVEYYRMCLPAPKGRASKNNPTPVMAEFCHQLLTAHQTEAARAFVPLVRL